jgi:hypothetical protein
VTDIRAERLAGRDAELQDVLALYAPLLAGLRAAAAVDRQTSLPVVEAVAVWCRPGFACRAGSRVTSAEAAVRFRVPEQDVRRALRVPLALGPGPALVNRGHRVLADVYRYRSGLAFAASAISGPSRSPSREVA